MVVVRSMDHIMVVICRVIHHEVMAHTDALEESIPWRSTCGFKLIVEMRNRYLMKCKIFRKKYWKK